MDFFNQSFLQQHIKSILAFYQDNIRDERGGYAQNFYDNGQVFASGDKHLVSSTRMVINNACAYGLFGDESYKELALHGLQYVETQHQMAEQKGYVWTMANYQPQDVTQQAYGYAFVLLMYARCFDNKVIEQDRDLYRVFDLLEQTFWQPEQQLYADELTAQGQVHPYRGQNANMHICEAMIAAYAATADTLFLNRAKTIAQRLCGELSQQTQGLIWEHYTTEFKPDWDYNKEDPKNLYRPWGFQPGHQTEWTKLLLLIYQYEAEPWLLDKAVYLFEQAYEKAWDSEHGGLIYGFDPDGNWCDDDKYFWVQAESFAAAALLYQHTQNPRYLEQYNEIWNYAWQHMIDHEQGAWYRVLKVNNEKYSNVKSQAGAKCDYHTTGACFDVLRALDN